MYNDINSSGKLVDFLNLIMDRADLSDKTREYGNFSLMFAKAVQYTVQYNELIILRTSRTFHFDISMDEIVRNKNKEDIAICLLKKHICLTDRQIGELFGNISYSAVAKVYWRFSEKLKKDKGSKQ